MTVSIHIAGTSIMVCWVEAAHLCWQDAQAAFAAVATVASAALGWQLGCWQLTAPLWWG